MRKGGLLKNSQCCTCMRCRKVQGSFFAIAESVKRLLGSVQQRVLERVTANEHVEKAVNKRFT